jgi:hypothetical protein
VAVPVVDPPLDIEAVDSDDGVDALHRDLGDIDVNAVAGNRIDDETAAHVHPIVLRYWKSIC